VNVWRAVEPDEANGSPLWDGLEYTMSADIVYKPDLVKRAETLKVVKLGTPRKVTGVNEDGPLIFTSATTLPSLGSEYGLTTQAFP
jgi:hypothetical protein